MRIVSLNIAQLAGKSAIIPLARLRAPKIAPKLRALLAAERPDVLALQEAPAKLGDFDPVAELLEPAAASSRPNLVRTRGPRHGPALLTRYPVRFQSAQHFKPDSLNGKGWALAELETRAGRCLVASVHLATLSPASRRRQIERLGALLDPYDGLKIVLGDVNSGGAAPLALAERLGLIPHSAGPTFPSTAPTLRLDWAFTSPKLRVSSIVSLSHLPSDHCALRLDVELP
jgi:endonuclease/exonuclease/phosphatase family metal-dependent hydrolase